MYFWYVIFAYLLALSSIGALIIASYIKFKKNNLNDN